MIHTMAKVACCIFAISNLWIMVQQAKADAPSGFYVYSRDGSESLNGSCVSKSAMEVTCNVVHVWIIPPEKLGKAAYPLYNLDITEYRKKFMKELAKKGPVQLNLEIANLQKELCTPENIAQLEEEIRDPYIGPKRKRGIEDKVKGCSPQNPWSFQTLEKLMSDADLHTRTCTLWVDSFSLDFKKVGEGQWLFAQKKPGRLSTAPVSLRNVLKIYELTADDPLAGKIPVWNLTETQVPMSGAEGEIPQEGPQRTVWSWRNYAEFEIPPQCEFISHELVFPQHP